jgi:hypothetical protein
MFVSPKATEIVRKYRQNRILKQLVFDLVLEANRLDVGEDRLIEMFRQTKAQIKEEKI